jgi:hypothetical protein
VQTVRPRYDRRYTLVSPPSGGERALDIIDERLRLERLAEPNTSCETEQSR